MDLSSAARAPHDPARLAAGTRLGGGRYTVVRPVRQGLFGGLYEATDATTGNGVSIHLLDPRLASSRELVERLSEDARRAGAVSHKNIAQVIELAVEGPHTYLVTELVEGHSLRELLERKRQTGTVGFGSKGALNIITHVCNGLAAAGAHLAHGALNLDGVAVSRAGRIRVTDLGLAAALPALARLGAALPPSIAPEVSQGGAATPASDVYGIGALLYELLVGAPPVKGCKRPSEVVPGVPAAVDAVIARCMAPAPAKRPAGAEAARDAIGAAMTEAASSGASGSRSAAISAAMPAAAAGGASLAESIAGGRASGQHAAAPGAPASAAGPAVPAAPARAPLPMTAALTAALADREERWLISKGKLDYGPFTLAQIAEQIQSDQILPGHTIIDKDTGTRTKVEDHPLLGDLADAAKERRDEMRRTQAEVQHATTEKRRGAALYLFIAAGVIALGGGAYMLVTKLSADDSKKGGAIDALEAGSLQAKISFPTKDEQKRRARTSRGKRGGGGPGGTAGGWDDSLNLDMSPDDSEDGGSERLSDSDVNPVIQRHGSGLARCLTSTGTRSAMIEFIVKPTGKVSHVRVNSQTGTGVANCVRGVMIKMQFPTFNGVRSKHYFDMSY